MPDKRKCDKRCPRCWQNHLKHGSKQAKAYAMKHAKPGAHLWDVTRPDKNAPIKASPALS